jgi:hypothetical protein
VGAGPFEGPEVTHERMEKKMQFTSMCCPWVENMWA